MTATEQGDDWGPRDAWEITGDHRGSLQLIGDCENHENEEGGSAE